MKAMVHVMKAMVHVWRAMQSLVGAGLLAKTERQSTLM